MKKILLNTSSQLIGRVIGATCAFFSTIILAKSLGSLYFGEYVKITVYVALFYPFVDFGLNTIYLKVQKRGSIERNMGSFLLVRLLIGFILWGAAVTIAYYLSLHQIIFLTSTLPAVILAASMFLGYAFLLTLTALFQVRARYDIVAIGSSIGSIVTLLILFLGQHLSLLEGERGIFWALGGPILGVFTTIFWCLNFFSIPISQLVVDKILWKKLLYLSSPLGLTLLFNIVYFKADTLILSLFRPSSEIGAYGFAYKFFEFGIVLPTFIMNSVYPELLKQKGTHQIFSYLKKIFSLLLIVSVFVSSILWFAAPLLIQVKQDFTSSVLLLRILAAGIPLFYMTSPLMWWYVLINKQKLLASFYGATMVFTIIANFVFIPKWGAIGAAAITGVTEFIMLLLGGGYLYEYYRKNT